MRIRQRCPHDNHDGVGRSDVSAGLHAEHRKHMVAGHQIGRGELGWRRSDCPKFFRPVVELQLFPIGESAGIDGDGDIQA